MWLIILIVGMIVASITYSIHKEEIKRKKYYANQNKVAMHLRVNGYCLENCIEIWENYKIYFDFEKELITKVYFTIEKYEIKSYKINNFTYKTTYGNHISITIYFNDVENPYLYIPLYTKPDRKPDKDSDLYEQDNNRKSEAEQKLRKIESYLKIILNNKNKEKKK